jgi:hypothetical protein
MRRFDVKSEFDGIQDKARELVFCAEALRDAIAALQLPAKGNNAKAVRENVVLMGASELVSRLSHDPAELSDAFWNVCELADELWGLSMAISSSAYSVATALGRLPPDTGTSDVTDQSDS